MNDKQRLVLFFVLAVIMLTGTQLLVDKLGLNPQPPKPAPAAAVAAKENAAKAGEKAAAKLGAEAAAKPGAEPGKAEVAAVDKNAKPGADEKAAAGAQAAPAQPAVEIVDDNQLVIGSTDKKTGYLLALQLDQKGAGVSWLASSEYDAEFVEGKLRHRPLQLIQPDPNVPPSFVMTLAALDGKGQEPPAPAPAPADAAKAPGAAVAEELAKKVGSRLDFEVWSVVKDAQGRASRPLTRTDATSKRVFEGQEIVFRTEVGSPALGITKTYRLWKGAHGFELELGFESPRADHTLEYQLLGPHGIPIEGEWYTGTFRDVFFGQLGVDIKTRSSQEVVKAQNKPQPLSASPLLYAGVENQYFAVFIEPDPLPTSNDDSQIAETVSTVIHENAEDHRKADVSVQLTSKPIEVGPNRSITQRYRVFAGSKRTADLAPYHAEALASYRKTGWFFIPLASTLAQSVISPLLDRIYAFTAYVAHLFGGSQGNYGIAIILLTITVRLFMFPLSRKQAISAKRMQDLQPLMLELKEKYKDDKERMTKETFALYGKHGVNPMGGCLPALIQLPIFVGLWQALNSSVSLRHASFLWIKDLSAPDMLFKFPFAIPLIGQFLGDYFNLLPILVVSLMLVQTKLFSPPATTPEQEMQQSTMKYMMIFMCFMFYRVPSGLGLYFITSSMWAICERLLLPKVTHAPKPQPGGPGDEPGAGPKPARRAPAPKPQNGGPVAGKPAGGGWWAEFKEKLNKLMEEASSDRTARNDEEERPRDRGRPMARPGKRK